MNSLAQLLSEKQPFEVREITTFSQKINIFDTNVDTPPEQLGISRKGFDRVVGL